MKEALPNKDAETKCNKYVTQTGSAELVIEDGHVKKAY